jgi:Cip1-like, core domain
MRTVPCVAGLALLSVFALGVGACSSSGGSSGAGGSGGGAGANGGGGGDVGGRGGASAGNGGGVAGTGGATSGVAGTGGTAGQGGGVAGASGTGGGAVGGNGGFGIAGPTRCDSTLPLCESVENGLDGTLWKTTKAGDATVVVDEVHAARGTKALHVKTTAGGGSNFAYIKETKTFPATNNVLYGRMFVWFEDALTTDGHFSLAEGAGTGTAAVIRFGGQFKAFGVGTDGGDSGDWTDSDRTKLVPTQTWICAEFQFDGPNNTFHVWWDDMERPMLASGPGKHASFTMPAFNSLWFGWWMYNIAEPQEIWIDEIAVDYKPIGCTK